MAALLLRWDDTVCDLKEVPDEVSKLGSVLGTSFGFSVWKATVSVGKIPQYSLEDHLQPFLNSYDQSGNLILIYYGGHGVVRNHELHWVESVPP
jgi:hypothetical protein